MGLLNTLGAIGGALLPGAGQVIGQAMSAKQDRKNIQDQFKHQKELSEYQYSKDLEMWERANAYNQPSQQMQRLKDAGLSPNLVYGKGATTQAATQLPKYQAPKPDYSTRRHPLEKLDLLSAYQDFQMKSAQIDNVRENNRIQRAEADQASLYYAWRRKNMAESTDAKGIRRAMALYGPNAEYKDIRGNRFRLGDTPMYKSTLNQLDAQRTRINQMDTAIELNNKHIDWYTFKLFTKLGLDVGKLGLGAVGIKKFIKPGAKGISGKFKRKSDRDWSQFKGTNIDPKWY